MTYSIKKNQTIINYQKKKETRNHYILLIFPFPLTTMPYHHIIIANTINPIHITIFPTTPSPNRSTVKYCDVIRFRYITSECFALTAGLSTVTK